MAGMVAGFFGLVHPGSQLLHFGYQMRMAQEISPAQELLMLFLAKKGPIYAFPLSIFKTAKSLFAFGKTHIIAIFASYH